MASSRPYVIAAGTGLVLVLPLLGISLDSPTVTYLLCGALLLVGFPHGALDLERIRGAARLSYGDLARMLCLYLALALCMLLLWEVAPVLALAVFLAAATVHFSEDWRLMTDPLLSAGMALSILSAPSLHHGAELRAIFAEVTGTASGSLLADGLLLVAPMALLIACVGIFDLARRGQNDLVAVAIASIAAMLLAPPIAGFALFFCLFHSPTHLREAFGQVRLSPKLRLTIVLALTGAALGVAALLSRLEGRETQSSSWTAATFMTLSILTIPHMLAPLLARQLALGRYKPQGSAT